MRPMTTTTALILNAALIVGLLFVLAAVMRFGHLVAGSTPAARKADRLELQGIGEADADLERAA
jgi:hypothetical protein